jgi:hypothetical protein
MILDTNRQTVEESVAQLVEHLQAKGYLAAPSAV